MNCESMLLRTRDAIVRDMVARGIPLELINMFEVDTEARRVLANCYIVQKAFEWQLAYVQSVAEESPTLAMALAMKPVTVTAYDVYGREIFRNY